LRQTKDRVKNRNYLRLSKPIKLFFLRTHFLSFSFILIVYRVLEAFLLNATLIFTLIIIIIIIIIIIMESQVAYRLAYDASLANFNRKAGWHTILSTS